MKRLWVRLSLFFSLVLVLGYISIGLVGVLITQRNVLTYFFVNELRSSGGLVDQLEDYYRQTQSWDGVDSLLAQTDIQMGIFLELTDEGGTILFNSLQNLNNPFSPANLDTPLPEIIQVTLIPIVVDGRTRGGLVVNRLDFPNPQDARPFIVQQLSSVLLVIAAIGGVIGVLAGIFVSRTLTAPLSHLEGTAREFGKGNLSVRAERRGSEEIVAVASAFNDMADSLTKAETLRRNLMADVAHELRTPLTVLQANLQAILDGVYQLDIAEIEGLLQQTEVLRRLVNDLHELAQAEAAQLPLDLQTVEINDLIKNIGGKFRVVAEEQGTRLQTHFAPLPLIVQADPNRLTQVLNNLLYNALIHTPSGGAIDIITTHSDTTVHIVIKDTGNGIPAEALPHVFERFYRVDRSRSRSTGGAGLGLAIVKAIVELHHGQVTVTSDGIPGHGATFTIRLPMAVPAGAAE